MDSCDSRALLVGLWKRYCLRYGRTTRVPLEEQSLGLGRHADQLGGYPGDAEATAPAHECGLDLCRSLVRGTAIWAPTRVL